MTTKVDVITGTDTAFDDGQTPIVVLADMDVETISVGEVGPPGPPGPQGPQGITGAPGNTMLYGPDDPTSNIGTTGNFYINTTTHFLFGPKAGGEWPPGISIVGPQGIPGNTVLYGAADPVAGTGVDGNFYINTTSHFLFGPKAAGAWPAGTSLIGPQGPQGIQGPVGPPGLAGGQAIAYISDTPPAGASDNTLWLESDTGILYARWNDGNSTQWVQVTSQVDATKIGAVAYNAVQPLTAAQKAQAQANIKVSGPTVQRLITVGTGQTYNTPANCTWIRVRGVAGGGGGGGGGTSGSGNGGVGGVTSFVGGPTNLQANGGNAGQLGGAGNIASGGTASGGNVFNSTGAYGGGGGIPGAGANAGPGAGGPGPFGGSGANSGGGGGGGSCSNAALSGGAGNGGAAGGNFEHIITAPLASYTFAIGAGGAAGAAGANGSAGAIGFTGGIVVEEYYN